MNKRNQSSYERFGRICDISISRRVAVSSSGLALVGLLTSGTFGQEGVDQEALRDAQERAVERAREAASRGRGAALQRMLERNPQERAFFEQMASPGSAEERMKMMQDWHFQQSLVNLKKQLAVSEEEWTVVQPRLETVLRLRRPPTSFAEMDMSASARVARLNKELWELVNNKEAKPEDIKAKLTALRAAKEQVRQELVKAQGNLRQILTIRQEAVLVLNGLLD